MTPVTPRSVILAVIGILGVIAVGGLAAITWLASNGTDVPAVLQNTTAIAVGAVSGLLANTRTTPEAPAVPANVAEIVAKLSPEQIDEMVARLSPPVVPAAPVPAEGV